MATLGAGLAALAYPPCTAAHPRVAGGLTRRIGMATIMAIMIVAIGERVGNRLIVGGEEMN
jgi:hypothetical protein